MISLLLRTLNLTRRGEFVWVWLELSSIFYLFSHEAEITPDVNKTGKVCLTVHAAPTLDGLAVELCIDKHCPQYATGTSSYMYMYIRHTVIV